MVCLRTYSVIKYLTCWQLRNFFRSHPYGCRAPSLAIGFTANMGWWPRTSRRRFVQQLLRSGTPHEDNTSAVLFNPYLSSMKLQKSPFMFYGRSQCHCCTYQALPFQHNATGQETTGVSEDKPAGSPPSTRGRSFLVSEFPQPYSQRCYPSIPSFSMM